MFGSDEFHAKIDHYYTEKILTHGATPRGVDWNSEESQSLRFVQLLKIVEDPDSDFSINDYGCGYGALVGHLKAAGFAFSYGGFDISTAMITCATKEHGAEGMFTYDETALRPADYAVASGIFNVKLDVDQKKWVDYLAYTLGRMFDLSSRGFAFNVLSIYSDPEHRRPDLYYADPLFWFDHCKRRFSPYVALLHDYPLYEFTILVRK